TAVWQPSPAPHTAGGLVIIDPPLPLRPRVPDREGGSQFLMYALPGLGELYVRSVRSRQPPPPAAQPVIALCFSDASRIDPAMFRASIALATERRSQVVRAGDEAFLGASRSLMRGAGLARRHWAVMDPVRLPALLLGGEADRLVPPAAMRQAAARN